MHSLLSITKIYQLALRALKEFYCRYTFLYKIITNLPSAVQPERADSTPGHKTAQRARQRATDNSQKQIHHLTKALQSCNILHATGCSAVWLAYLHGVQVVGGSNPLIPTIEDTSL